MTKRLFSMWLGLLLEVSAYILIFLRDWKIGLGVFAIHWSINLKARKGEG